ncbi:hypothetical protein VTI74DRAFT_8018 [Chaetomium olivicolor]
MKHFIHSEVMAPTTKSTTTRRLFRARPPRLRSMMVTELSAAASPGLLPDSAKSLLKSMFADPSEGLGGHSQTLHGMANTIEPIVRTDLRDVFPFAVLSASRTEIEFRLLTLAQDSTVQVLQGDDIYPSTSGLLQASDQYEKSEGDNKKQAVGIKTGKGPGEDALSKLQAAFWGAIAAMLLNVIISAVALFTGIGAVVLLGAGVLFVGGLVATIALSVKTSELEGEISKTKGQIDVTNTAITELSAVVNNFTKLDKIYGTLNVFRARMFVDTNSLKTVDDVTAKILAEEMFEDTSSIVAAKKTTARLNQCHADRKVNSRLADAQQALAGGDIAKYEEHRESASSAEFERIAVADTDKLRAGVWYDNPRLNIAAALFNSRAPRAPAATTVSAVTGATGATAAIKNGVDTAAPAVVAMLHKTRTMCATVQDLCRQYKERLSSDASGGVAGLQDTLQKAIVNCTSAQRCAAQANNAFTDINHALQEYQQELQTQENQQLECKNAARASADQAKRNITCPWSLYLGGPLAVTAYIKIMEKEISDNLDRTLAQLDASIASLEMLEQSGATLGGHTLMWTEMVKTVSGCLGSVFNILTAVLGQVVEDPGLYDSLLNIEWTKTQENTDEVLHILASRGVDVSPPVTATTDATALAVRRPQSKPTGVDNSGRGSDKLARALMAPIDLGATMSSQAKQAHEYFS